MPRMRGVTCFFARSVAGWGGTWVFGFDVRVLGYSSLLVAL
jgi:hypothetical protein